MIGRRREEWRVPLGNWPSRPRHSCTIKYQTNLKKSCLTESIVCRYLPTFVMVRAFVERLTTLLGQIFLIERLLLFGQDIFFSFQHHFLFGTSFLLSFDRTFIKQSMWSFTMLCPAVVAIILLDNVSGCYICQEKKLSCILSPPHPLSFEPVVSPSPLFFLKVCLALSENGNKYTVTKAYLDVEHDW